jgi:predicted RNA binding protein YcfA (HicA-like mRNA interferase family)
VKPPLCSSAQVCAALERLGFVPRKTSKGSHRSYGKPMPNGIVRVVIVVLGKREIPRWTLENILDQAGISVETFLKHLR